MAEELSTRRRARKVMDLPATGGPATMYVWARCYPGNHHPLRIAVNDSEIASVRPQPGKLDDGYSWYELEIPADRLIDGSNRFLFWADSDAMNAWSLGVEYGHASSGSEVSTDGGTHWSGERLGYLNVGRGEYAVRIRLAEGDDPAPPHFVAESRNQDGLVRFRELLDTEVKPGQTPLEQVRVLATWAAGRWGYRNAQKASQYAPWDPLTIIAWGEARSGQAGRPPITFCVHYAVTFVSACWAYGIPARCVVFAEDVNSNYGHFAAEVWIADLQKWVLVDANEDALFSDGEVLLSAAEVCAMRFDIRRIVRWGPGHRIQTRSRAMRSWINDVMLTGRCFVYFGIWPRADFFSHPEQSPPSHGWGAYAELDFIWPVETRDAGFGMFRYFAPKEWFASPLDVATAVPS
jgi:hypothetical protein